MNDSVATRGDRRLHFQLQGEPATDSGRRPLVLIPGLGGGSKLFGTLPRRFAREGFQTLTFDPVGIPPSSDFEGEFDFSAAAADLEAVLNTAGLGEVDLVGTSLGGKVSLQFVHDRPDRVRRLVLLASSAVVSPRARRVYRFFERVAATIAPEDFATVVAPFLFGATFHNERTQVVDDIARATRPTESTRRLMTAQARALQDFDGMLLTPRIDHPVLCCAGLEDTLTDPADVRATAAALRHGELAEFERAGHSLLLEDKTVYDRTVEFLTAH